MIKGEYDYLKALAEINECAEHGTPLVVATHPSEALWVLRCGEGHYPDTIRHIPSLTEEYKQGTLRDGPIKDNIVRREKRKAMIQPKNTESQVLGDLPRADLATGEFLAPEVVNALVRYAKKYGLDAYRGHVVVMYGKPYIGIDGYLYHAKGSGIAYTLESRPLGDDELKEFRSPENAHVWLSKVKITETGQEFVGYGVVTHEEMEAKSPRDQTKLRSPVVAAHPQLLAQKRAEWQALRRGFPIGESEEEPLEAGD